MVLATKPTFYSRGGSFGAWSASEERSHDFREVLFSHNNSQLLRPPPSFRPSCLECRHGDPTPHERHHLPSCPAMRASLSHAASSPCLARCHRLLDSSFPRASRRCRLRARGCGGVCQPLHNATEDGPQAVPLTQANQHCARLSLHALALSRPLFLFPNNELPTPPHQNMGTSFDDNKGWYSRRVGRCRRAWRWRCARVWQRAW